MLRQQSGRAKRHMHSCVFLLRPPLPKARRRGGRQFFDCVKNQPIQLDYNLGHIRKAILSNSIFDRILADQARIKYTEIELAKNGEKSGSNPVAIR